VLAAFAKPAVRLLSFTCVGCSSSKAAFYRFQAEHKKCSEPTILY